GSMFLGAVDAFLLVQQLKLNGGSAFHSDDPLLEARSASGSKRKKRPRSYSTDNVTLMQQARNRLREGDSAPDVENWLRSQGLNAVEAADMIDKLMGQAARQDALARDNPEEEESRDVREAREKLANGATSEQVERWLRAQGHSSSMASAIVAD